MNFKNRKKHILIGGLYVDYPDTSDTLYIQQKVPIANVSLLSWFRAVFYFRALFLFGTPDWYRLTEVSDESRCTPQFRGISTAIFTATWSLFRTKGPPARKQEAGPLPILATNSERTEPPQKSGVFTNPI